ncbi:MAG: 50S ribosomal protein L32 [Puniceicoccales bacterium]|nr:50S ribosomal protein L32 [Puniceicoccales bacterium]
MRFFLALPAGPARVAPEVDMAQPKRKNSKQRSHKRRGAKRFEAPQLARDRSGGLFLPHHVNPETGQYRGRQVLEVD